MINSHICIGCKISIEFHRCWLLTLFSYAVYLIICILCPFIYPNQYPHEGMSAANFPMLYNWFTPKLNRHKMLYNLAHVIVADIRSNVLRRVIMLNNTSTNKPF